MAKNVTMVPGLNPVMGQAIFNKEAEASALKRAMIEGRTARGVAREQRKLGEAQIAGQQGIAREQMQSNEVVAGMQADVQSERTAAQLKAQYKEMEISERIAEAARLHQTELMQMLKEQRKYEMEWTNDQNLQRYKMNKANYDKWTNTLATGQMMGALMQLKKWTLDARSGKGRTAHVEAIQQIRKGQEEANNLRSTMGMLKARGQSILSRTPEIKNKIELEMKGLLEDTKSDTLKSSKGGLSGSWARPIGNTVREAVNTVVSEMTDSRITDIDSIPTTEDGKADVEPQDIIAVRAAIEAVREWVSQGLSDELSADEQAVVQRMEKGEFDRDEDIDLGALSWETAGLADEADTGWWEGAFSAGTARNKFDVELDKLAKQAVYRQIQATADRLATGAISQFSRSAHKDLAMKLESIKDKSSSADVLGSLLDQTPNNGEDHVELDQMVEGLTELISQQLEAAGENGMNESQRQLMNVLTNNLQ